MNFQQLLLDATEAVLTWEIPEEDYAEAITNQACLMAGINTEEFYCFDFDRTINSVISITPFNLSKISQLNFDHQ